MALTFQHTAFLKLTAFLASGDGANAYASVGHIRPAPCRSAGDYGPEEIVAFSFLEDFHTAFPEKRDRSRLLDDLGGHLIHLDMDGAIIPMSNGRNLIIEAGTDTLDGRTIYRQEVGLTTDGARALVEAGVMPSDFVSAFAIPNDPDLDYDDAVEAFERSRAVIIAEPTFQAWRAALDHAPAAPKTREPGVRTGRAATVRDISSVVSQLSYTPAERLRVHAEIDAMPGLDPSSRRAFKAHVTRRTQEGA